jgi:nitrogen regulatory protein P-II 2
MTKHPKTLLVIFAESVLERRLVADAKRFGAHGYTVWDVRGGSHLESDSATQTREGAWDSDRTIEMKLICSAEVANQLAEHVLKTYAPHHGVSLYFADVQVMRPEKF